MAGVSAFNPDLVNQTGGGQQIVGGKTYTQYSPEWYAAMKANEVGKGTTIGQTAKAAYDAMGNPADTSSSTGRGSLAGIANTIPRIGDTPGVVGGGGSGATAPGGVAHINAPDMEAANAAEFAHAKDQVGQETSGGLTSLRSVLASRGMLGSGAESRGTVGVLTKGMGELGDVSRSQAEKSADQNLDIAKTNYSGDITQRGQSLDYSTAHRGQDITQRGQDIQQQEANAQLQLTKSLQEAAQRQSILNGILQATSTQTLY